MDDKTSAKGSMNATSLATQSEWRRALIESQRKAAQLFGRAEAEQRQCGYFHTLKENRQQPWTWLRTCDRMIALRDALLVFASGIKSLVFTGSGSSEYAGDCVRFPLQNELSVWGGQRWSAVNSRLQSLHQKIGPVCWFR